MSAQIATQPNAILITLGLLIVGKILWSWVITGRLEKGVYVKITDCKEAQANCGAVKLREDFAAHQAATIKQLENMEKRLDEGHENFKEFRGDMGEIKESLAGMRALMEKAIR